MGLSTTDGDATGDRDVGRVTVPRPPRTFKVVLVATGAVLATGAGTRATVGVLTRVDSIFDVTIYVWHPPAAAWRQLTPGEQRTLWDFRALGEPPALSPDRLS